MSRFFLVLLTLWTLSAKGELPDQPGIKRAFEDSSGRLIVQFIDERLYYGTEKNLFQIQKSNGVSSLKGFNADFYDPRVKRTKKNNFGSFYAGYDENDKESTSYKVVCGDEHQAVEYSVLSGERLEKLQAGIYAQTVPTTPLSDGPLKPKFLFKGIDGTLIYLDAPAYARSERKTRFFIGKPGAMKELKIVQYTGYRDGGSLDIKLDNGQELSVPPPDELNTKPKWNGTALTFVDHKKFDLASLKIHGVPAGEIKEDPHTPCDKFFPPAYKSPDDSKAGHTTNQGINN